MKTRPNMIGDCRYCGHSIAYHLPFVGCTKCDCEEFGIWLARVFRRICRGL